MTALLVECRGDWQFFRSVFGVSSWSSDAFCWMCRCSKSSQDPGESAWNFSEDGPICRRRVGEDEFHARLLREGLQANPLFSLPYFSHRHIKLDVLHTADLGVSQLAVGHVLWESLKLVHNGTYTEAIVVLAARLKAFYQEFKPSTRIGHLSLEMIRRRGSCPKLRAKGAECRHVIGFAVILAAEFRDEACLHSKTRHLMIRELFDFYLCLGRVPFDHERCKRHGLLFLQHWRALRTEAEAAGRALMYPFKPKFHLFGELLHHQLRQYGDPSRYWCYGDEDEMGFLSLAYWAGQWHVMCVERSREDGTGHRRRVAGLRASVPEVYVRFVRPRSSIVAPRGGPVRATTHAERLMARYRMLARC
jgi:hypothetical protein